MCVIELLFISTRYIDVTDLGTFSAHDVLEHVPPVRQTCISSTSRGVYLVYNHFYLVSYGILT